MSLPDSKTLEAWLYLASEAAMTAGVILQDYWGKLSSVEEKGPAGDLLTAADRDAEAAILKIFSRHLPDHGILAEESGTLGNPDSAYLWAIDPLDGTTNYAHQYPISAVSIGLTIHGVPSLGVVYDPARNELFRAATGLGATCNRRSIHVSSTLELSQSLLVTGFAYDRRETPTNNYAEFCHLTHLTQGVRRGGAAAIDLVSVACGRLDGYWERGLSPWDVMAGAIIVQEAGGQVTAYDGSTWQPQTGRILATNGKIHNSLSATLLATPPLSEQVGQPVGAG